MRRTTAGLLSVSTAAGLASSASRCGLTRGRIGRAWRARPPRAQHLLLDASGVAGHGGLLRDGRCTWSSSYLRAAHRPRQQGQGMSANQRPAVGDEAPVSFPLDLTGAGIVLRLRCA